MESPNTTIDEINDGIYRISTWIPDVTPVGFTFNQFLVVGDEPLLFHTGARGLFPLVAEAMSRVVPVETLRWITFGHVESDECGSMNLWLAAAPKSTVAHGEVGVMVSLNDLCDRPPRALANGEVLDLGGKRIRHLDTPHVPHGWDCGVLFDETTQTLLCGDLFTQPGSGDPALTEGDILGPSEAFRHAMDYFSYTRNADALLEKLANTRPTTLACMHGSAWRGDAAALLRALSAELAV